MSKSLRIFLSLSAAFAFFEGIGTWPTTALAAGVKPSGIQLVQIKSGSWYSLVAEHSGKALEIQGDEDGAALQQDEATGANNELFQFRQVESGWFEIISKSSGKALELKDASVLDHTPVQQNAFTGRDSQLFALVQDTDGSYSVISKLSGYCFDILGGVKALADHTPVIVYPAGSAKNHKFKVIEAF